MDYETDDVKVKQVDDITVVRIKQGNLQAVHDVERVQAEIMGLIDRKDARKLVLDFKPVEFFGSSALGMLLAVRKRLADLNGKLVLSRADHISELLRISKTERLFTVVADARAALKEF